MSYTSLFLSHCLRRLECLEQLHTRSIKNSIADFIRAARCSKGIEISSDIFNIAGRYTKSQEIQRQRRQVYCYEMWYTLLSQIRWRWSRLTVNKLRCHCFKTPFQHRGPEYKDSFPYSKYYRKDFSRQRITAAKYSITWDTLHKIWDELNYGLDICLKSRAAHIKPL